MTIRKETEGSKVKLFLEGRLDTTTAPELEAELESCGTDLLLDFEKLSYISSAGLRVLLSAQKAVNAADGSLTIANVNEEIMEVFDMTGFSSFLNIV